LEHAKSNSDHSEIDQREGEKVRAKANKRFSKRRRGKRQTGAGSGLAKVWEMHEIAGMLDVGKVGGLRTLRESNECRAAQAGGGDLGEGKRQVRGETHLKKRRRSVPIPPYRTGERLSQELSL